MTSKGLYSAEHNRGWARVLRQVDVQQVKEVEPVDMQVTVNPPLGEWRATSVCVGPQPGPPPPLLLRRRKGDGYEEYDLVDALRACRSELRLRHHSKHWMLAIKVLP